VKKNIKNKKKKKKKKTLFLYFSRKIGKMVPKDSYVRNLCKSKTGKMVMVPNDARNPCKKKVNTYKLQMLLEKKGSKNYAKACRDFISWGSCLLSSRPFLKIISYLLIFVSLNNTIS